MKSLGKFNKLWVALAGALVAFLTSYFGADSQWVTLVIGILTALGVFQAKNQPSGK